MQNFQCFLLLSALPLRLLSLNLRTGTVLLTAFSHSTSISGLGVAMVSLLYTATSSLQLLSPFLSVNLLRLLALLYHLCPLIVVINQPLGHFHPILKTSHLIFFLYSSPAIALRDYQSSHYCPNQFPSLSVPWFLYFQPLPPPLYFSL